MYKISVALHTRTGQIFLSGGPVSLCLLRVVTAVNNVQLDIKCPEESRCYSTEKERRSPIIEALTSCLSARLSLLQSRRREDPLSLVNHNESSLLSRELFLYFFENVSKFLNSLFLFVYERLFYLGNEQQKITYEYIEIIYVMNNK